MTTQIVQSITDEQLAEIVEFTDGDWAADWEEVRGLKAGRLRALITRLREAEKSAAMLNWLVHQGDSCQWMNIIKVDPDDFESYAEAIRSAMEAKP